MQFLKKIDGMPTFAALPMQVLLSDGWTFIELRVFAVFCAYASKSGLTSVSQSTVAEILGYACNDRAGYETVARAVTSLRRRGWLKLEKKGFPGQNSINRIVIPDTAFRTVTDDNHTAALETSRALNARAADGERLLDVPDAERHDVIRAAAATPHRKPRRPARASKTPATPLAPVSTPPATSVPASPATLVLDGPTAFEEDVDGDPYDWVTLQDIDDYIIRDYIETGFKDIPDYVLARFHRSYPALDTAA